MATSPPNPTLFPALARIILAGNSTSIADVEDIATRCCSALGRRWRWIRPLAKRYLAHFGQASHPGIREVVAFLRTDPGLELARRKYGSAISIRRRLALPNKMHPAPAATGWAIPRIETEKELADWLRLYPEELAWFADLKGLGAKRGESPLNHYNYRLLTKKFGSIRLIEAPKVRLKQIQREILTGILDPIPTHPAAHGFVPGRSIKTFAAPHVGKNVVLRMDLEDFFPSVSRPRIHAFFRTAGYPEPVANLLGSLCTNVAPHTLWRNTQADPTYLRDLIGMYARPHLPQGASTSPALANHSAYRIDCRLTGLAKSAGAIYTRYADDLGFSGDEGFARGIEHFAAQVGAILLEEGFHVHHRKTRIMRQGVRQYLAGLVVNQRLNVVRADFDRLKAILTNCNRLGVEGQNRDSHPDFRARLAGQVSFVESVHPDRGAHLRRLFNRIRW